MSNNYNSYIPDQTESHPIMTKDNNNMLPPLRQIYNDDDFSCVSSLSDEGNYNNNYYEQPNDNFDHDVEKSQKGIIIDLLDNTNDINNNHHHHHFPSLGDRPRRRQQPYKNHHHHRRNSSWINVGSLVGQSTEVLEQQPIIEFTEITVEETEVVTTSSLLLLENNNKDNNNNENDDDASSSIQEFQEHMRSQKLKNRRRSTLIHKKVFNKMKAPIKKLISDDIEIKRAMGYLT